MLYRIRIGKEINMRIFHLADLHFGKGNYGQSFIEDQRYWIKQFMELCKRDRPDAIVVAGDVYDSTRPTGDALELLSSFISGVTGQDIPLFIIAGNHDNPKTLEYASEILDQSRVYIAGRITKEICHVTLEDPDGKEPVTFWLLPYIFPEAVSKVLEREDIRTYEEAMRALLGEQNIDTSSRNILLSHQNVTCNGAEVERGGSESLVGGVGAIDWSVYDGFDYVALGHIHSGYPVGRPEVRYAGTPLCYHLNEANYPNRGVIEVTLGGKGEKVSTRTLEIPPLHRMRYIRGTRQEIYDLLKNDGGRGEYIGIDITDERRTLETDSYLRGLVESRDSVLLSITSSKPSDTVSFASAQARAVKEKSIEDLFSDFYTSQKGEQPPTDEEYSLMQFVAELQRNHREGSGKENDEVDKIIEFAMKLGGGER